MLGNLTNLIDVCQTNENSYLFNIVKQRVPITASMITNSPEQCTKMIENNDNIGLISTFEIAAENILSEKTVVRPLREKIEIKDI